MVKLIIYIWCISGLYFCPLLFLIFINDIDKIPGADMVLFADDAALYVCDDSFDNCFKNKKNY